MDPTKHNYYKKLIKLHERGQIPAASLCDVDIYHDDWCRVYTGGYCNCDPEIELHPLAVGGGGNGHARAGAGRAAGPAAEETRSLVAPVAPCPHCGCKEFIFWQVPYDPGRQAISCSGCGAVMSSTHPLDPEDRPRQRP